jgi:hypothetical protein
MSRLLVAGSLCIVRVVLCLTTPVAAEPRDRSVLQNVPALGMPFSCAETKISLGDLVAKVSTATGVSIAAAPEVADEPLAVVVAAMPARALLEQVAELLDYQWRAQRVDRGQQAALEIYQDLAGKQREEALRQAAVTEAQRRLRQQVQLCVELAGLSHA